MQETNLSCTFRLLPLVVCCLSRWAPGRGGGLFGEGAFTISTIMWTLTGVAFDVSLLQDIFEALAKDGSLQEWTDRLDSHTGYPWPNAPFAPHPTPVADFNYYYEHSGSGLKASLGLRRF
jgi:hypothetical protein